MTCGPWTRGLNSDITMLSVDLSQTGLSDSEQAAVAWAFGEHGISQVLSLNYEQLAAEGYLTGADPDSDGRTLFTYRTGDRRRAERFRGPLTLDAPADGGDDSISAGLSSPYDRAEIMNAL